MAYLGINYAAQSIAQNTSDFYNGNNFRDAEIISTLLLTEDGLDAIRSVDGVMSRETYQKVFGKEPENNTFYAHFGNDGGAEIKNQIEAVNGVENLKL